ncbi:MAG: hypothetical protein LBL83_09250 [Clostridiales bacterium]|nr:hypothetical protein [Clostridiales bacterium]
MELDIDRLVEQVTEELMRRLGRDAGKGVLLLGGCPDGIVSEPYSAVREAGPGGGAYAYVLLTAEAYRALKAGGGADSGCAASGAGGSANATAVGNAASAAGRCCGDGGGGEIPGAVDLTGKRLLHERDLREHNVRSGSVVRVSRRAIVTALASDYAKGHGVKIVREQGA